MTVSRFGSGPRERPPEGIVAAVGRAFEGGDRGGHRQAPAMASAAWPPENERLSSLPATAHCFSPRGVAA